MAGFDQVGRIRSEASAGGIRTANLAIGPGGTVQHRVFKAGALYDCLGQIRMRKDAPRQVCLNENRPGEISAGEIQLGEVGPGKVAQPATASLRQLFADALGGDQATQKAEGGQQCEPRPDEPQHFFEFDEHGLKCLDQMVT